MLVGLTAAAALAIPVPGSGQDQTRPWNDDAVMHLVRLGQAARTSTALDPGLTDYEAHAEGHVYFYVERPDSGTRVLVKADQVALDLFWRSPGQARQRIVGQRDRRLLPTNIRYHLDHLTVVQDDFGQRIRLGNGDEVESVLHPMSPEAEHQYDYRLTDSLTLRYGTGSDEVLVYEVEVRPKDLDAPGFVGAVYLDRDRGAIVRMNFSFTPSSYVDPFVDAIHISLDNARWSGGNWLPYRQEVEIRREHPLLDVLASSVILTRFRVGDYEFNQGLPDSTFWGPTITRVPTRQRSAYLFRDGLLDGAPAPGDPAASTRLQEVRQQVEEVVQARALTGLNRARIHTASVSDVARYDRAEGLFLGAGASFQPNNGPHLRLASGWSFGRARPTWHVRASGGARGGVVTTAEVYGQRLTDMGGHPGASLLENSVTTLSGSKDYLDPYFRSGLTLTFTGRDEGRTAVRLRWEEHEAGALVVDDPEARFRPVRGIDRGTLGAVEVVTRTGLPWGGRSGFTASLGRLGDRTLGSLQVDGSWVQRSSGRDWHGRIDASAGVVNRTAPAQSLFLLGGRHTLPGHPYRAFEATAYWLVRSEVTVPVRAPYLGLRGTAAVGGAHLARNDLPTAWSGRGSYGLKGSLGLGISIGWDALRIDLARAVGGSGWEVVASTAPAFGSWL